MKSSYIPVSFKFGDVLQAEYVTAVNKLLRCFDPETVGATLKGHHGPFFGRWCDLGYLAFTVGNRKFRLENQMVCLIPCGKLQATRAFAEEDAFFHSLVSLWPSSETQGRSVGREKRRDESFQARAEKPLGTDSHRTISKRSSECWLLIGHEQCFVLLYPIGEQHLRSSFHEFVHDGY